MNDSIWLKNYLKMAATAKPMNVATEDALYAIVAS